NNCPPEWVGLGRCSLGEMIALLDAADERDRLLKILGGLCCYPLCACTTEGCMVIDSPVPSVCARSDLTEEHARATAAEATARQLAEALKLFRKAKAWLAADDYDDGPEMRRAFEFADSAADLALATPEVKALIETGT
ncbi:hypothetical protein LCGC14_2345220, partial [marine sediment metagenome]